MRLIDADDLIERAYRLRLDDRERIAQMIESAPTIDAEPTEEQVREYCLKRCLTVVTDELFNEMKARWSNEPVVRCKDCKHAEFSEAGMTYCPEIIGSWVDDDWFCADGERREDDAVSVED